MSIKEFGLAPLALALTLGACASLTPASWSSYVAKAQAANTVFQTDTNTYMTLAKTSAATVTEVQAIEAKVTADLAALAASPVPVDTATALSDAKALVDALPPGPRQAEADALITALQLGVAFYGV